MVRHSHHHVPAHIGGVKFVPPCCGCGGINRQQERQELARKRVGQESAIEQFTQLQQANKKEAIPNHVREMAGIKINQQLSKDTVTFAQVLEQKGISKEKALEKLLDKLVAMYNSEKELMKALKKMDINKLLEILKKALTTVKETELSEEETLKKKVDKTKKGFKVIRKHEAIQQEEEKEQQEEKNSEDNQKDIEIGELKEIKNVKESYNSDGDSIIVDENNVEANIKEISNTKALIVKKLTNPIKINTNELRSSGIKYSSSAKDMLKIQTDIEEDAIRKELLQKNNADNPLKKSTKAENYNKNEIKKSAEDQKMRELQKENERLRKIILDLQKERRSDLISSIEKR